MLHNLGHKTILYCGEGSETLADEQVICVSDALRKKVYGDYDWKTQFFKHDPKDEVHQTFNKNAIEEINARKSERDFLLCPMGNYQKPIADAVGLMTVESGIGYSGVFAPYKVFESYAWMHHIYGLMNQAHPSFYDCVIPNYYDPTDFLGDITQKVGDYYLFIGRLIQHKGLQIAIETTEKLGAELIVAGQGDLKNVEGRDFSGYDHVWHVGTVGLKERNNLYRNAIATFVPTTYIGPFEGVAVESQLCGTPAITTDWGVFAETVEHGKTGYRCRTLNDFYWASLDVLNLNRKYIRQRATENYSIDRVMWKYQQYFDNLYDLWYNGWYQLHESGTKLSWLEEY
jgi:glycosyltransferase involved in cell wall biosynthesis